MDKVFQMGRKGLLLALIVLGIVLGAGLMNVHASAAGYTTESFSSELTVNKNHTVDVTERIRVNFEEPKHGIYRVIPKDDSYRIKDIEVAGSNYDTEHETGGVSVRIGDEDSFVQGVQEYVITYRLVFIKTGPSESDFLSIDLLPEQWETSIAHAEAVVHLPEDFDWSRVQTESGAAGSTGHALGTWQLNEENHTITFRADPMPQGSGATLKAELPAGYWTGEKSFYTGRLIAAALLGVLFVLLLLLRIRDRGKGMLIIPIEVRPPEDMTPTEIGYIADQMTDRKDILSLIFYLAHKGYLRIESFEEEQGLLKRKKSMFRFIELAEPTEEKEFVQVFHSALFAGTEADEEGRKSVRMDELPEDFGETVQGIPSLIDDEFKNEKSLVDSKTMGFKIVASILTGFIIGIAIALSGLSLLVSIPIAIFELVVFILGSLVLADKYRAATGGKKGLYIFFLILYVVIELVIVYALGEWMNGWPMITTVAFFLLLVIAPFFLFTISGYTEYGRRMKGRVFGFRRFIQEAELKKLEALIEEEPQYFYGILPYAYVFGLTDTWAEHFEGMKLEAPSWYIGSDVHDGYLDYVILYSMLHNIDDGIHEAMMPAMSEFLENSTDFSGGFSGGVGSGGGGGGGGAW